MKRLVVRILLVVVVAAAGLAALGLWRAGDAPANHDQVLAQLFDLRALLQAEDVADEAVSGWSVHQHVEHLLRANEGILGMIAAGQAPDPIEPKALIGRVVLMAGFIPRGRGQAPPSTVPEGLSAVEALALLDEVERAARAVDPEHLPQGVVGNHVVFGGFTATDWLRLMAVHDAHHLEIVGDILAAGRQVE